MLRLTVFGWLAMGLIALLGAVATWATLESRIEQTNYIYAFAAVVVAMLALSWPLARWNLHGIEISRELPDQIIAGEPFAVTLVVKNRSRWLPRLAIELEDALPTPFRRAARQAYVVGIPPRTLVRVKYEAVLLARGVVTIDHVELASRFPFGLVISRKRRPCPGSVVVYPAIGQVHVPLQVELGDYQFVGGETRPHRDAIDEYFGVRDYRHGDHPRMIHWKASARRQALQVREFQAESFTPVLILLDTRLWQRTRRGISDGELAISFAATVATDLTRRGRSVALATFNPRPIVLAPGGGRAHLRRVMEVLALIQTTSKRSFHEILDVLDRRQFRHMQTIAICIGPRSLYHLDHFRDAFPTLKIVSVQDAIIRDGLSIRQLGLSEELFGASATSAATAQ